MKSHFQTKIKKSQENSSADLHYPKTVNRIQAEGRMIPDQASVNTNKSTAISKHVRRHKRPTLLILHMIYKRTGCFKKEREDVPVLLWGAFQNTVSEWEKQMQRVWEAGAAARGEDKYVHVFASM